MKKEVFLGLLVSLFLVGCNRSRQEQTERFLWLQYSQSRFRKLPACVSFPFWPSLIMKRSWLFGLMVR